MPFLPNLKKLVRNYPDEINVAIKNMVDEYCDRKVTIFAVKKLIKKHIDPLSPKLNISSTFTNKTTWQSIEETGKFIARQYANDKDFGGLEYYIGETLRHIAKSYPRKATNKYKLDKYETSGFCYLCWRHSVSNRKFCLQHDPVDEPTRYRSGKRLLNLFHEEMATVHYEDAKVNANKSFPFVHLDKRTTPDNVKNWIIKYRPFTWEKFNKSCFITTNKSFFKDLLICLDTPFDKEYATTSNRNKLYDKIINDPSQLSGMLFRCEAWLRADKINKSNWGGSRINSGRKNNYR